MNSAALRQLNVFGSTLIDERLQALIEGLERTLYVKVTEALFGLLWDGHRNVMRQGAMRLSGPSLLVHRLDGSGLYVYTQEQ